MDKIKLVIWDLDETFWRGTLSEEGVEPIHENIELVKTLTDRGIINSIVSKNDFEAVRSQLESLNVWQYFVFPSISWSPKGILVQKIIEKCQLRDINVLFLDDNHLNLKEAEFYNPKINTKTPDFIPSILTHEAFSGKDDRFHTRLNQYKLLEKKDSERAVYESNTEFLRSSRIQIQFLECFEQKERIFELIERTNQLNYTKIRSDPPEIEQILTNKNYTCRVVRVCDKFGDYGIVGFFAFSQEHNSILHFVFSCRILNLGVVQYVYNKLGSPNINIVPDVAEDLKGQEVDWIVEVDEEIDRPNKSVKPVKEKIKVFFKGGCDLDQMLFYLSSSEFDIIKETNYVAKNGMPIHREHTHSLLQSRNLSSFERQGIVEDKNVPFVDEFFYQTRLFDFKYDCLVYSVLMDYTQEMYRNRKNGYSLTYGGYDDLLTNEKQHDAIVKKFESRKISAMNNQVLRNFSEDFDHIGQISPEIFQKNLLEIRTLIPSHIPIIFINGAEVRHGFPREVDSTNRHMVMNIALDKFVQKNDNVFLLDVRKVVDSSSRLRDNIRHYDRSSYQKISIELIRLINEHVGASISEDIGIIKRLLGEALRGYDFLKKMKGKNSFLGRM